MAFGRGDTLYGATASGRLCRIDINSGDTTGIGTAPGIVYAGLAWDSRTGRMWASVSPPITDRDMIYIVDTRTGAVTLVGRTGDNSPTPCVAFSPAGILYGLKGIGGQQSSLIRIDTITAAGTLIGSTGVSGLRTIVMRTDVAESVNEGDTRSVPSEFLLEQNYPNPFNPRTDVKFQIAASNHVKLSVYDVLGREVVTLMNEWKNAGTYSVAFDATQLSSGMYLYRLQSGSYVEAKKMVVIK